MENQTENTTSGILYDADARQTYKFEVTEFGEKFETAHVYKPLTDERYLQFLKSVTIEGDEDEREDNVSAVSVSLWRDLIESIENIEVEEGQDFRNLVDAENEILPSINNFLAVAIVEPERAATGKRKLGAKSNQIVTTEMFFSGTTAQQTHVLSAKSEEFSKKYDRIVKREYKQEITKGLRRKPKLTYVPQDESKGVLYDEMFLSQTGFASRIPLRAKVRVIDHVFQSTLDPKK